MSAQVQPRAAPWLALAAAVCGALLSVAAQADHHERFDRGDRGPRRAARD